jgi:predicted GNAT family acetyltransferase
MIVTTRTASRLKRMAATATLQSTVAANSISTQTLRDEHESEVLAFLARRPLHTFVMAGHIRDNGLESPLNRGRFYACRNGDGGLEGVALIGHATVMETRCEAALAALAHLAQTLPAAHMIMGEQEKIHEFWKYYAKVGQSPRRVGRELLLEQRRPVEARAQVVDLRLATLAELEQVMLVQSEMAFAESGINPLEIDAEGFRKRCARRIGRKRVWVWVEDGRLIFKADVISDTPEVIYLEGVYVNLEDRGRGFGTRCMLQLGRTLLKRTDALCILVNEQNRRARCFFEQVGFRLRSYYDTIFLEESAPK